MSETSNEFLTSHSTLDTLWGNESDVEDGDRHERADAFFLETLGKIVAGVPRAASSVVPVITLGLTALSWASTIALGAFVVVMKFR